MPASRIGKGRQQRFLAALSVTGNELAAASKAGVGRAKLLELREDDQEFGTQWEKARETFAERLEQAAYRQALQGIPEPLVSDGKCVRDDEGNPLLTLHFSDSLLLALLKAERPEKFGEYAAIAEAIYPAWVRRLAVVLVVACSIWVIGDLALRVASLR